VSALPVNPVRSTDDAGKLQTTKNTDAAHVKPIFQYMQKKKFRNVPEINIYLNLYRNFSLNHFSLFG